MSRRRNITSYPQETARGDSEEGRRSRSTIRNFQSLVTISALVSIALLASDILLPIPSSVIMTFNGTLFSLTAGALVSLAGLLLGAVLGYDRADDAVGPFFDRFGLLAVVLSRPIPLIAEMVTCMAGTADMRFGRFMIGQLLGGIPLSVGYAWAGDFAAEQNSVFLALFVAAAVPSLVWLVWAVLTKRMSKRPSV